MIDISPALVHEKLFLHFEAFIFPPVASGDIPPFKGGLAFQTAFGRHMRKPSLDREGARQGGWNDECFPVLVPLAGFFPLRFTDGVT